jgi:DNA-binding transcriptional LysR family regulator
VPRGSDHSSTDLWAARWGCLREACSGLTGCLIEHDLHAIRVLESYGCDDAARALSQLDQAIRRARLAASGKLGLLRIGFISTAGSEIVPNIIRQFRELNPEVEFSLRAIPTADQIQMLEIGSLDIGFFRLPIGGHSALDVVTVHREPFVLVVPTSHKLAKRKGCA